MAEDASLDYGPEKLEILKKAQALKKLGDKLSGQDKLDLLPERDPRTGRVPGVPQAGIYNPKTGKVEGEGK